MDNISDTLLKTTDNVIHEVYKDALQPSVRSVGEILGFLPRTVRLLLRGWEKWLINGEESLKLTGEAIEEKMKSIPPEKIIEPEPYVAIPAIQQLTYCQDNQLLRNLYANLLVSSMDIDTKWIVHPSFVDIIKQLNPDEAKFLHGLKAKNAYPLLDIRINAPSSGYGEIIVNFTAVGIEGISRKKSIPEYIDNLNRLGIIRISQSYLIDNNRYIETIKICEELFQIPKTVSNGWEISYHKHLFELTDFGASFVQVVVKP